MPELSVLIVNYNSWRECVQAIATLREFGPTRADGSAIPFEVIVVDNLSPKQQPRLIKAVERELELLCEQQGDDQAGVLIMHTENGGYSKGMNLAMSHSRGKRILVSNPDVLFNDGLVSKLLQHLESDPKIGIAVPKGFWIPAIRGTCRRTRCRRLVTRGARCLAVTQVSSVVGASTVWSSNGRTSGRPTSRLRCR